MISGPGGQGDSLGIQRRWILRSPEVLDKTKTTGFKEAMATFDATQSGVAASAIGGGKAALDFVREVFEKEGIPIRYGTPPYNVRAAERDFREMEANLHAPRLLTWRSACLPDAGKPNNLESSMARAKAGKVNPRLFRGIGLSRAMGEIIYLKKLR